jgi:tRNA (guanine37-N1)-methyltransferase
MTTRIDILTLFPEMFEAALGSSILRRAAEHLTDPADPTRSRPPVVAYHLTNIRDHTADKHHKVDQPPFGGGPGMVIQAQPVYDAALHAQNQDPRTPRRILMTPQGTPLTQQLASELAAEPRLLIIAGHYEGIDQRAIDALQPVTEISLGDYVLTGGELPAMVLIDAIVRLIPGALGDERSATQDSFTADQADQLEGPVYTRPRTWQGRDVPEVLLSGDHARIAAWRQQQALQQTRARRPDLLATTTSPHPVIIRSPRPDDTASLLELAHTLDPAPITATDLQTLLKTDAFIEARLATHRGRVIAFAGLLPATLTDEPARRGLLALHPLLLAPEADPDTLTLALTEELAAAARHAGAAALLLHTPSPTPDANPAHDHDLNCKSLSEKDFWLIPLRPNKLDTLRGPVTWPPKPDA